MILALLVSCAHPLLPVQVVAAECSAQADNTLRFDCTVVTEPGGVVRLELSLPDGGIVVQEGESGEVMSLWGLVAGREHAWRAMAAHAPSEVWTGVFTPASPPFSLEVTVTRPGTPALSGVLVQFGCDGTEKLVVVDVEGRLRWYEDPARTVPKTKRVRGFEVTEEGSVLALFDNEAIVEVSFAGEVLLDLRRGRDFTRPVHHDVTRRRGFTYVLDALLAPAGNGTLVVWDGFTVFDAEGASVASWDTRGVLDPAAGNPCCGNYWRDDFGDALDFAHSNAIAVDDALDVWVSYRYIDTLQRIAGDPAASTFGTVRATLAGSETSPVPDDFVLVAAAGGEPTFQSPHHVRPIPGGVALFDNRWDGALDTRILEIALSPGKPGTATITSALSVGEHCPIQGSAFPLEDGSVLTVCSGDGRIFVLDAETSARTWEIALTCPVGTAARPPYRAVPVLLPGAGLMARR